METNPAVLRWLEILRDPWFRDVPFKVETTRAGAILMSPASNWHGSAQSQVVQQLSKGRSGGEIIVECSILTSDGVKVADVAWASETFMEANGYKTPYHLAPEICAEVVSPGNSPAEIEHKVDLYLAKGAQEVWVVQEDGAVLFFAPSGRLKRSAMVRRVAIKKRS